MNELKALESMELVLPSPAYILGTILFGLVGYVAFRRGRRLLRPALTWTGVVLMFYPYAVSQTWMLWVVGVTLCAWLRVQWD
jgi:hypothetical protein